MDTDLVEYTSLLQQIKTRIGRAQVRAALSANRELLCLHWEIGAAIVARQQAESWGAGVLRRLATDLKNELPGLKGFSERNLKRMTQFYRAYPDLLANGPQPVAHLGNQEPVPEKGPQSVAQLERSTEPGTSVLQDEVLGLPWGHNILLLQKVGDLTARRWYMQQTLANGWSRAVLDIMIGNRAHERQGSAVTNFSSQLPEPQSDLAQQALKDPFVFDFLTLAQPFRERELEAGLVRHLERFMLELGVGFAFVGRQYHLEVGDSDFYLDLLFYHLELRCFVVIDLKVGAFKPDYAGKMNFYLNVVDDLLRHDHDNPSIGLILCQDQKRILAEYALRGLDKPIGVSEYELTRSLPERLESALPTIEQIEAEFSQVTDQAADENEE